MPIHTMNFDNGVFFAMPVGYFDNIDGRMWANALKNYAKKHPSPVVAVLDTRNVERMCSTLPKVFVDALTSENVLAISIATSDSMSSRHDRVLKQLAELPDLRVFTTLADAQHYASSQLNPRFGMYTAQSSVSYSRMSYATI